jgi:predicted nucleic acid-binding protein
VLIHPFIIGELACGNLKNRNNILHLLHTLPQCRQAAHDEVLTLLEMNNLYGKGIGWIDAHLLGSAKISGAELWTYDRTLAEVYETLR